MSNTALDTAFETPPTCNWVVKRDGNRAPFDAEKINGAIIQALQTSVATDANSVSTTKTLREHAKRYTNDVLENLKQDGQFVDGLPIETIQDSIEKVLMQSPDADVAKRFILYRHERAQKRASDIAKAQRLGVPQTMTDHDGSTRAFDVAWLERITSTACENLDYVDANLLFEKVATGGLFEGIHIDDLYRLVIATAHTMVEKEPNYSFVSARVLLQQASNACMRFMDMDVAANDTVTPYQLKHYYPAIFKQSIQRGVAVGRISKKLANNFDVDHLASVLRAERDMQFRYLGLQTLVDRYFLHIDQNRIELPQTFFMRVAMGLAIHEDNPTQRAEEFYHVLSSFDYVTSTPTLFNSGTNHSQMSSCYISTVEDDLQSIFSVVSDNALLSKWAGGIGNDWTPIRAMGARIKGTNGKSQGVVPFLKVVNDTTLAVDQGGKRKGAACVYLETWHLDVEQFVELRKNTGDDRRRIHDINTANWIPDLFMQRVAEKQQWTLFSPDETPDLHDLYGQAFAERYQHYERLAEQGQLHNYKQVDAFGLWKKMLSMIFETGHPWMTFKDPCNLRSPQQHVGVVHSSNLCTEITLNTSKDEIAVCNLGSINLNNHLTTVDGKVELDTDKLKQTVRTAVRMLDNVIDINYYAVDKAKHSNLRHRPVGLGLMAFQDVLFAMGHSYASEAAVQFADTSMEHISYYAIEASSDLAAERGRYQSYEGSLWDQGILPIDSLAILQQNRDPKYCEVDTSCTLDWQPLRDKVAKQGMRNSNVMAIAPTATIANIIGINKSIEPLFTNLHAVNNLSGGFVVTNGYLVEDLRALGLWDAAMCNEIKAHDGDIGAIERIPQALREKYTGAFDIDPSWLIRAAARRQKWLDQAQSLNLYVKQPTGKSLDAMYSLAWRSGLKTTYYLRSLAATQSEKSTIHTGKLNHVQGNATVTTPQACAIDDPTCDSCQ